MNRLFRLFGTSIGRKLVMAVTGLLLIGFVVGHMFGNMAVFQGPDAINSYAAWLQGHPFLWIMRGGLLAVFLIHVVTAISLALENLRARPTKYHRKDVIAATFASRYIVVSGLLLFVFVVYHLLHFTFGVVEPQHAHYVDAEARHDVFRMVIEAFRSPAITIGYVLAMLVLGFHLHHGAKSLVQTLGFNHESYEGLIRLGSLVLVTVLVIGNCSIPLLVLAGFFDSPGGN